MEIECKFLKKLKIEFAYDPAIPLLNIYTKESMSGNNIDNCIPTFIATLLTQTESWNQPGVYQWMNDKENMDIYTMKFAQS
jgi:hypothetical protein